MNLEQSLVIKNYVIYDNDKEEKWINFYNNIFTPNEDYIEIRLNVYPLDEKKTIESFKKMEILLLKIYNYIEKNNNIFNKMIENKKKKIKYMTMDYVYSYFATLIEKYTEVFFE